MRMPTAGTPHELQTQATLETVARFNVALNAHDLDAIMALMTEDCVFENTTPRPDGERYEGQAAARTFWANLFHTSPDAHFETEELFATGDRCTVRWRYTLNGTQHITGVDVLRVRDGPVAEKLAYVKG
jgi:ketosteroid isomerase-like protein